MSEVWGVTESSSARERAFLELIERHAGILQKVARAYCPVEAQRPDLVQEMMVAVWRSFDRFDRSRSFATWIYRIALNVAISFYRAQSRQAAHLSPIEFTDRAGETQNVDPRVGQLLECIDSLTPLDKALVLMYLDGYAHAEIADVLGITESNAGTKLTRIKDRLRRGMAEAQSQGEIYGTR